MAMYTDLITPRAFPDLLQKPDYDPMNVIPWPPPAGPRIFTTAGKLAAAAERIKRREPVDLACMNAMIEACGLSRPLPAEGEVEAAAAGMAARSLRCAVAFQLTGDSRYFERSLALLQAVSRSKAWEKWNGYESQMFRDLAAAYDLLAAHSLSRADESLIRGLLAKVPEVLDRPEHRRCNNHNVFNILARLAVGLAIEDRQAVHDALYGLERNGKWRYGLIHQLRHDMLADGMQWEGTMSYHMLVMAGLCETLMILENVGIDLWHRSLPNVMQDEGHDEHRGWGPRGEKNIRAGIDAFIYQALPNGDYSGIHDQILGNVRGAGAWWPVFIKGFEAYGDLRYAAVQQQIEADHPAGPGEVRPSWLRGGAGDLDWIRFETRSLPKARLAYADDTKISLVGRHENGCSLFPVHGSAVLRSEPDNAKGLGAYLYFGPHWAGHRSPGCLHLDFVFNGQRVSHSPHLYKDAYVVPIHLTWYRTTIAHNTVSVDERTMFPFDFETDSLWETDFWRNRVSDSELRFFTPTREFKAVRVVNENVYEGSRLDRTVVTTPTMMMDVFRVSGESERQYDWAMHLHGDFARPGDATSVSLGEQRGYRHFSDAWAHPQRSGRISTPLAIPDVQGVGHVFLPTQGAPSLVVAKDPEPDTLLPIGDRIPPRPRTAFLVRNRTRACVFVSVWEFGKSAAAPIMLSGEAGGDVTLETHSGGKRLWTFANEGGVSFK